MREQHSNVMENGMNDALNIWYTTYIRLLPLPLLLELCTRNNTDGNKLVMFSGIAYKWNHLTCEHGMRGMSNSGDLLQPHRNLYIIII